MAMGTVIMHFFAAVDALPNPEILLSTAIGTRLTRFDHLSKSMQYEEMLTLPLMI